MDKGNRQTITQLLQQFRTEKTSPVDLVKNCLSRIRELNPKLNAFITVCQQQAISDAVNVQADRTNQQGPGQLQGIPIALKDFYDTAGIATTAAFEPFKDRVPTVDAVVVTKLKQAGAILLGKTNMHQLGIGTTSVDSFWGAVHNPIDPAYVAGGSSGGSAVAVATSMCLATVDTDAIGSCRLPAACCGVTGFKVSNGLISMEGILAGEKVDELIRLFSAVGITTTCVTDTRRMLQALQTMPASKIMSSTPLRIGVVRNFKATDEIKAAFRHQIKRLQVEGYTLIEVDLPFERAVFSGEQISQDRGLIDELLFSQVNFLILPTLAHSIPTVEEARQQGPQAIDPANTFFCNYFGLPAISLPYAHDERGFPLCLQLVGQPQQDWALLEAAQQLEQLIQYN